jgi:hypothetical protein
MIILLTMNRCLTVIASMVALAPVVAGLAAMGRGWGTTETAKMQMRGLELVMADEEKAHGEPQHLSIPPTFLRTLDPRGTWPSRLGADDHLVLSMTIRVTVALAKATRMTLGPRTAHVLRRKKVRICIRISSRGGAIPV